MLRVASRVQKMKDPATFDWIPMSNVARQMAEYLVFTDPDNVTHPLPPRELAGVERPQDLDAPPQEGHPVPARRAKRREFEAADVTWNLKRWLAKETGSSIRGLMSYLPPEGIEEVDRIP